MRHGGGQGEDHPADARERPERGRCAGWHRGVLDGIVVCWMALRCAGWHLLAVCWMASRCAGWDRNGLEEIKTGELAWPFWTKLVVVAIGFTGGLVFMYIQCKVKILRQKTFCYFLLNFLDKYKLDVSNSASNYFTFCQYPQPWS